MAYMRRYSTRKYKPYNNRRSFRRTGSNIDARRDSITFKMREWVEINPAGTPGGYIASCTLNPLYQFINTDSRYATFIKTCDEFRLSYVRTKLQPYEISGIDATHSVMATYAWDRSAKYQASNYVNPLGDTAPVSINSMEDVKTKALSYGQYNCFGGSIRSRQRYNEGWLMCGVAPTVAPNTGFYFCPEFKLAMSTIGAADVLKFQCEYTITLETRGKRMMSTV